MKTVRLPLALFFFACGAFAQSFEVAEASITDLQRAMAEGRATSKSLVQAYLKRIEAFDTHGPKLNSLILLNPKALQEAEALDKERAAKGPRGPLHGIPIIVKDNYSTTDMQTTAGSMALFGFVPSADAFQIKKLREAGAVILGKSNLHELASGITTISSAGGQTLNPYDPTRNPGGSSGGTGAAIAASLAAVGMGSDTCGSIRIPSSQNNLVGLRPTKGLSSIAGIVPLSTTQDTGGPLARTVEDLAIVLDATIGEDPADPATVKPGQVRPLFRDALKTGSLKGARIGVLEPLFGDSTDDQEVIKLIRTAVEDMKKRGAVSVTIAMPELTAALTMNSLIGFEFAEDLAGYLKQYGPAQVSSLKEIMDKGLYHAQLETNFRLRVNSPGRDSEDYRKAQAKRAAVTAMILKLMDEQKLDALVYPTMKRVPAKVGEVQPGSNCQMSPSTGFPAISIPAGFTASGLPVGVELFGRPFDDGKLVSYAFDYEQATHHRKAPALTPALGTRSSLPLITWKISADNISASFTLDPATNELQYSISAKGNTLAATLHRASKEGPGPVIFVLANHPFTQLNGSETLSPQDRARLFETGLYLRVTTRTKAIELPLKPKAAALP